MDRENKYEKEITGFYLNVTEEIKFKKQKYTGISLLTIL